MQTQHYVHIYHPPWPFAIITPPLKTSNHINFTIPWKKEGRAAYSNDIAEGCLMNKGVDIVIQSNTPVDNPPQN